jgi:hypothetical protein
MDISMDEMYIAEVDFDEAKQTADLMSYFQDLAFTISALDRLQQLIDDNSKDEVLAASLWIAALITYARCFSTGKRFGLSEKLFEGIEGGVECHQLYMNLRNKHIAHSVNPYEQVVVGLVLSPPSSPERKVEGVSILSQKLLHLDSEGVQNLRRLTLIAMKEIEKQGKEYQEKTLEAGKKIPIDILYIKASPRTVAPGPEEAGKPRK